MPERFALIIPALNEEDAIGPTLEALRTAVGAHREGRARELQKTGEIHAWEWP